MQIPVQFAIEGEFWGVCWVEPKKKKNNDENPLIVHIKENELQWILKYVEQVSLVIILFCPLINKFTKKSSDNSKYI